METTNKDTLIERVKKLLAKAESAKELGNQAEAEAFAAGAQKMMLAYGIEQEELRKHTGGKIQLKHIEVDLEKYLARHESDWIEHLFGLLSKGNLCYAVLHRSSNKLSIMGQPHNLDLVLYIAEQFIARARVMARESFKNNYEGPEKRNTYIRGFLRGFAQGVGLRLKEEMDRATSNEPQTQGLMVINNNAALTAFVQQKYPRLRSSSSSRLSGSGGIAAGVTAGRNTTAHKGVSASTFSQRRLA